MQRSTGLNERLDSGDGIQDQMRGISGATENMSFQDRMHQLLKEVFPLLNKYNLRAAYDKLIQDMSVKKTLIREYTPELMLTDMRDGMKAFLGDLYYNNTSEGQLEQRMQWIAAGGMFQSHSSLPQLGAAQGALPG